MKAKPKGPKYRNLHARGETIYYEREAHGKRVKKSLETNDWTAAAARRDLYEESKGITLTGTLPDEVPLFVDFTKRYLEEDTSHLATTTRRHRNSYLRADGPLLSSFGTYHLDEITLPMLREWWNRTIIVPKLAARTGRAYLDVLQGVLAYAIDLELLEESPVPRFRETIRRRSRTKAGRTERDPTRNIRPIERPEEIERLVAAATANGEALASRYEARRRSAASVAARIAPCSSLGRLSRPGDVRRWARPSC